MQHLEWSDALALELPAMDQTHREFVDLLAAVNAASDDDLLDHWTALVEHTDDHFSREDDWMQATRFASSNCHSTQHKIVLQVLREGLKRGQAGELAVVRQMAQELVIWFPHHAQAMDASLALHLRSVGFDTAIVPKHNLKMIDPSQFPGLKLVGVSYLREAINAIKLK